jgi:hypothetical protein
MINSTLLSGLLLNIPSWIAPINSTQPMNVQIGCSVMYVIGMQSWWRPYCGQYGANNLLYASILINCFILYIIIRYICVRIQNVFMSWQSEGLNPVTLRLSAGAIKSRTWKAFIGKFHVMLILYRCMFLFDLEAVIYYDSLECSHGYVSTSE